MIQPIVLQDDGTFPNNRRPLLLYPGAVPAGDAAVIPAGVAHRCVEVSPDFRVVGAYPRGQRWDMCYGKPGERPEADRRVAALGDPEQDPVQGAGGALCRLWEARC